MKQSLFLFSVSDHDNVDLSNIEFSFPVINCMMQLIVWTNIDHGMQC